MYIKCTCQVLTTITMCIPPILINCFTYGIHTQRMAYVENLGDSNAKFINHSTVVRDKMFCNVNHVCNLFPVNCLPSCSGAKFSCVSYDNKYEPLIDFVCVPLEVHDIVDTFC